MQFLSPKEAMFIWPASRLNRLTPRSITGAPVFVLITCSPEVANRGTSLDSFHSYEAYSSLGRLHRLDLLHSDGIECLTRNEGLAARIVTASRVRD